MDAHRETSAKVNVDMFSQAITIRVGMDSDQAMQKRARRFYLLLEVNIMSIFKKRLTFIAIIMIGCLIPVVSLASGEPEGAPVAVLPQTVYEFPPVLEGQEVIHDFVIQNKGTAVLKVERVKTG